MEDGVENPRLLLAKWIRRKKKKTMVMVMLLMLCRCSFPARPYSLVFEDEWEYSGVSGILERMMKVTDSLLGALDGVGMRQRQDRSHYEYPS